jgi:hypothetical protein
MTDLTILIITYGAGPPALQPFRGSSAGYGSGSHTGRELEPRNDYYIRIIKNIASTEQIVVTELIIVLIASTELISGRKK